jgi:3'-phosphoadenosine 5'-phosphosulfate sulfotransferase (PAPS reductase)/FAD synthetase
MDIDQVRERIGTSRVIVSTSGGKDSAAAALYLRELGIPFDAVFLDTGWEARETYDYLRGPLTDALGPIRWLRAEVELPPEKEVYALELEGMLGHYSAMVRTCLKKIMLPARQVRWCTQATKVEPMHRWLDSLDEDVVSVVGIRADESEARKNMPEWEWSDKLDRWTWRPIIAWTLDDVIAIHARHGLIPNPLYLKGASRVGCWPCIFARKSEIRFLADHDPNRLAVIRRLEEIIGELYRTTRVGSQGKRPASLAREAGWWCPACDSPWPDANQPCASGAPLVEAARWEGPVYLEARAAQLYQPPTWFQHNSDRTEAMRTTGYAWPIDRVVEWSRTAYGGKQYELFASTPKDAGCMRWGLCDTGSDQ